MITIDVIKEPVTMDMPVSAILQRVAERETDATSSIAQLLDEVAKHEQSLEELRLFRTMLTLFTGEAAAEPLPVEPLAHTASETEVCEPELPEATVPLRLVGEGAPSREELLTMRDQLFGRSAWGHSRAS